MIERPTFEKNMDLVIAAVQSASFPGDIDRNVAHHSRFGALAADHGAQLLVFPELSLTGYEPALARACAVRPDALCLDPLRRFAQSARMTLVCGAPLLNANATPEPFHSFHRDDWPYSFSEGALHIGTLAFLPDGSISVYTKEHLHTGEERIFTSGSGGSTLEIAHAKVALAICADTTHASHPAAAADHGAGIYAADVLITEEGYAQDTALLSGYALKHRMAVLMANPSGVTGGWASAGRSAVWSEDGQLAVASKGTGEALVVCSRQGGNWEGAVLPGPR